MVDNVYIKVDTLAREAGTGEISNKRHNSTKIQKYNGNKRKTILSIH